MKAVILKIHPLGRYKLEKEIGNRKI